MLTLWSIFEEYDKKPLNDFANGIKKGSNFELHVIYYRNCASKCCCIVSIYRGMYHITLHVS